MALRLTGLLSQASDAPYETYRGVMLVHLI